MLFSSIFFIFIFLPIVLAGYFIIPSRKLNLRNTWLLVSSLVFYSWGEPVYIFLMIYSAFFNYFMALQIDHFHNNKKKQRSNLIFTIIINLFILGFFKYSGFLVEIINSLGFIHIGRSSLPLPIGISFYTFQALSYIMDVYRRDTPAQKNFLKFTLYLSLFPQLIAGPIIKYRDVSEQLSDRTCSLEKFGEGSIRFITGLGKKVILANSLGAIYQGINDLPSNRISILTYWIGIIAYTLQIYFDFSGYSDMAIGLGKIFGFEFMENFNYPYISKSVTEFWRRWHISLSTWFKEYLYIPLGGNRVKPAKHILNLLIVWGLTGLWHGAAWNFILWGLWYGVILIIEKYITGRYFEKLPLPIRHTVTMVIVMIGWVLFSQPDLASVSNYIGVLFGVGTFPLINIQTLYVLRTNFLIIALGIIGATQLPRQVFSVIREKLPALAAVILVGIMLLSTSYLIFSTYNPFLYFRF